MFEDWKKELIVFVIVVILPVWIFNLAPLTLSWKIMFTVAGLLGIFLYFEMGLQLKYHK